MSNTGISHPARLGPGATVGLIAPAGPIRSPDGLQRAAASVAAQGFRVVLGESCGRVYGHLSGTDAVRARDINRMFADGAIDAIFCLRGGYGSPRLLDMLDYRLIARHPKPFLGYSDITALHVALLQNSRLASYHGPMPASDWIQDGFDPRSMRHLLAMLTQPVDGALINPPGFAMQTIQGGVATGTLVGGNLTLIAGLCGTKFDLDARGKILFLEDIGEKTYRLDHLLTQLRGAGKFDSCAGVIFGEFTDCPVEYPGFGLDLGQIIRDVVVPCGKPILLGLRAGHCQPSLTLPLGAMCRLDADAQSVWARFP